MTDEPFVSKTPNKKRRTVYMNAGKQAGAASSVPPGDGSCEGYVLTCSGGTPTWLPVPSGITYNFTYGLPRPFWHVPFFPSIDICQYVGVGIPDTFATNPNVGSNVGGITTVDTDYVDFATGTGTSISAALPVFVNYNVAPTPRTGYTHSYFVGSTPNTLEVRLTLSSSATASGRRVLRTAGDTSDANAYTLFSDGTGTVLTVFIPSNINMTASNTDTPVFSANLSASRTWTLAWQRLSMIVP